MKLKKGSKAAKEYMASIRKMKKTSAKKVGASTFGENAYTFDVKARRSNGEIVKQTRSVYANDIKKAKEILYNFLSDKLNYTNIVISKGRKGHEGVPKLNSYGAIKIVEKGESKNARPSAVYQYNRTKKGTFKGLKKIGATKPSTHKDTKSHNVNIRVVSGIQKTISGMQKNYIAIYQTKLHIIDTVNFKASSLQEAKKIANAHKKISPKIKAYKSVKTSVKLSK